jgi:ligand-binding sensor domain-containing protein/two-component sensor histidine kinase
MTTFRVLVGVAVAMSWAPPLYAAQFDAPESQYTRTLWTARDGLPSPRIYSITQDADGFLWLGTSAGLTRFDGKRFEFGRALDDRTRRPISAVRFARDGSLWFAFTTTARVGRLTGRDLVMYDQFPGPVATLTQTRDGTIWAGGAGGLSVFRHDRWEPIAQHLFGPASAVNTLFEDQQGNIWVGTSNGVYRRPSGEQPFHLVIRMASTGAREFAETSAGEVLVNDPEYTIRPVNGPSGVQQKAGDLPRGDDIHLLYDRTGSLWLATTRGLQRFVDYPRGRIEQITTDNSITTLFQDRDANIWMSTADGLVRLSPSRIVSFTSTDRSLMSLRKVVAAATDGSVWAATRDGIVRFFEGRQTFYGTRDGAPSRARALHAGRDGAIWIGTDEGLTRYLRGRFESFRLPDRSQPHSVLSITSDLEGSVWLSDLQGLFRWKDGRFSRIDFLQKPPNAARIIYADASGRLWVGVLEGAIAVYDRGQVQWYSENDGLAQAPIVGIGEDARGVIWVATTSGISRFENGQFRTLRRGIPGDVIIGLVVGQSGDLWVAVNSGIVRLSQHEFDKAIADPSYVIHSVIYDASDGLVGMPRFDGGNPNATRATDGTLWFATTHGVTVLDPRRLKQHQRPPRVVIEEAFADTRQVAVGQPARLPAGTSVVQVHFTAPAVDAETKLRFRHLLEGFDKDWVLDGGGAPQSVLYTNLFPGSYRLRIGASYGDGVWSQPDAVWEFSVAPSFYQTRSFYAFCAIGLALSLWTAWQIRLGTVRRQLSVVFSERARVGREIHDTLLQSLIGVALQLDNISTELDNTPEVAKQQLQRVRREVEHCVGEANQSIWNLRAPRTEIRALPELLRAAAENIAVSAGAQFEFSLKSAPRSCAPAVEQQLLRIAQEAVTNAIRHARAEHVRMVLEYQSDVLHLVIADDGCGFDPRLITRDHGRHWGLTIMQERAQQIGGRVTVTSVPNAGTTVEVFVPCSGAGET